MFSLKIIDNWYNDPDQVREFAIRKFSDYSSSGKEKMQENGYSTYPGYRIKSSILNLVENRQKIENYSELQIDPNRWVFAASSDYEENNHLLGFDFQSMTMKIRDTDLSLNMEGTLSNGCFQYCDEKSDIWIHADSRNEYAAVIYLTPDPEEGSGTGFFKYKENGCDRATIDGSFVFPKTEAEDFDKWELVEYAENVYNRCIIFDAKQFHSATKYFGSTPQDSRLIQVFFFDELKK